MFHDAGNDVADLKRDFGFRFASIADTRIAAQFCGRGSLGLDALLKSDLGIDHLKTKGLQRCDWTRRPLTPAQERYASEDVVHLLALRDRLHAELRTLGREAWAAEECALLAETPPSEARKPSDYLEVKGARHLGRKELAVLRELVRLRENLARRKDLAPFMVVDEAGLLGLACGRPKEREALERTRGLSRRFRQHHAAEILEAIRRGETASDPRLPERPRRRPPAPVPGAAARTGRLKAWRAEASKGAGLDPGLLLPQRLIDRIAAEHPADLESLSAIPAICRWRVNAFGAQILAAIGR